jgi:tRNA 2-thiouridine synthesizing protein E
MGYEVNGREYPSDDLGYVLEATIDDDLSRAIASADGIELTDAHWEVIRYLRDAYQADGHSPNFRNLLKGFQEIRPEADSKTLYDLFPMGPAKQGAKIAGLPQPYGKGGY